MHRPHIYQHHIAFRLHLVIVLVQIRRHRRALNPHYLQNMLREEKTDWNEWD
jgi:hypothetical protein